MYLFQLLQCYRVFIGDIDRLLHKKRLPTGNRFLCVLMFNRYPLACQGHL